MRIFIGSSSEEQSKGVMNEVSTLLQDNSHEPLPWNEAIPPGGILIQELIRISHEVDGAIFIFAPDDTRVVRRTKKRQPRDNVVFEYGLFTGTIGSGSVVFLRVGKTDILTDLQGVVYIDLPSSNLDKKAREEIENWASRLAPVYVKGLGFDLANHLRQRLIQGRPLPVENILREVAPKLVARNRSNEIRALCSDKGESSEAYYKMQFDWMTRTTQHRIKRIFVRTPGDDYGFSPGETLGIKMHLNQTSKGVTIRWIFANNPCFKGPYPSSLGFAIFGKSWIVHWGLVSGISHDPAQGTDYGVLELLNSRFTDLWDHATDFDASLIKNIRERQEVGS